MAHLGVVLAQQGRGSRGDALAASVDGNRPDVAVDPERRVELGDAAGHRMFDRHEETAGSEVRIVEQIDGRVQRRDAPFVDLSRGGHRVLRVPCQPDEQRRLDDVGQIGVGDPCGVCESLGQRIAVALIAAQAGLGERLHHARRPRRQGEHQGPAIRGGVEAHRRCPLRLPGVAAHIRAGVCLVEQVRRAAVDGACLSFEGRHVDVGGPPRPLAHHERGQCRHRCQVAHLVGGDVAAELDWLALLDSGAPHRPAHGVGDDVAAAVAGLRIGTGLSERRDGSEHDARPQLGERFVAQADTVEMTGRERLDHNVGLGSERPDELDVVGTWRTAADVGHNAALVGVEMQEERRLLEAVGTLRRRRTVAPRAVTAGWVSAGRFHLDDIGAVVGEELSQVRARDARCELEHPDAGQQLTHCCPLGRRRGPVLTGKVWPMTSRGSPACLPARQFMAARIGASDSSSPPTSSSPSRPSRLVVSAMPRSNAGT